MVLQYKIHRLRGGQTMGEEEQGIALCRKAERNTFLQSPGRKLFQAGEPWRTDQESSGVKRIDQMYKVYHRMLAQHILPALGEKNAATLLGKR